MSKKHIEEQKLLIENFNKWINEEKCGEKDLEENLDEEAELAEEEQIDEIFLGTAVGSAAYGAAKFVTTLHDLMGALHNFTKVTDEMLKDPNTPQSVKDAADSVKDAAADVPTSGGELGAEVYEMSTGRKLTNKAIQALVKKHLGIDIEVDVGKLKKPEPDPQQPDPNPAETPAAEEPAAEEPDDSEKRSNMGLMSKEKEARLAQLRKKFKKKNYDQ